MNCERFQTIASELARKEIMEAGDRTSAMAHIEECERCGQTWSEQRELSEGLLNVARQMNSLQAPVAVEERLRLAFRDRARVQAMPVAPPRWRYWVTAAAAALLIAFGVMAWRAQVAKQQGIQANRKDSVAAPAKSGKPDEKSLVANVANQSQQPPDRIDRDSNHKPRKFPHNRAAKANPPIANATNGLAANSDPKEITTDFVALGYATELDLQDGGQVLRVELPRSALARFGLPMNMDRADERVKADLLVGTDGLARAIRFVK